MCSKKIIAGILAAAMVAGNSVMAFAEEPSSEGTSSGTGTLEGTVDTDVFAVVLPTDSESAFDFILDPEGLIAATDEAHYSGKTFEEGKALYFSNAAADKTTDYSSKSDLLDIINKSSMKVDVSISAALTDNTDIKLAASKTFENDTDTSIYLALIDGDEAETALTASGATATATIDAAAESSYEYKYEGGAYKYELKADLADDNDNEAFSKYSFGLTGDANKAGDWSEITETPKVSVTYKVVPHVDAYVSSSTVGVGSESVTLSLPESVTIKSVVLSKADGSTVALTLGNTYTVTGTTLGIKATVVSANKGGTIKVTYSDDHVDVITIQ